MPSSINVVRISNLLILHFLHFTLNFRQKVKTYQIMPNSKRNAGPKSKRRPEPERMVDEEDNDNDSDIPGENQTDDEKRRVRTKLREIYDTLLLKRDKITSGTENEDLTKIINEANEILKEVKGTHEAMEDAKMFRLLCQLVREMSEDTNTNEKKFHLDEFAANVGRFVNASTESGNYVKITSRQLISLGQKLNPKFRRSPSFSLILGTLDTEVEDKPRKQRERRAAQQRQIAPTKTAIVEKSQADGQMTDKLVTSTRKILEQTYRNGGKKPVNYFKFVIDPESFGRSS